MNKAEFVEWLGQFDDDVVIQVAVQQPSVSYQPYGEVSLEDFTDQYEYVNFNGNPLVKPEDEWYGKKYLILGERS